MGPKIREVSDFASLTIYPWEGKYVVCITVIPENPKLGL